MSEPKISKTGQWIDTATGKVVSSRPESGVQIVSEGGEITPSVESAIEAAKTAASETAPVETAKVSTKRERRG